MATYTVEIPGKWNVVLEKSATKLSVTPEALLLSWAQLGATDAIESYVVGLTIQEKVELLADSLP